MSFVQNLKTLFFLLFVLQALGGCIGASERFPELKDILPEAPGQNCALGGERIISGKDFNYDGYLHGDEIIAVTFDCKSGVGQSHDSQAEPAACALSDANDVYSITCDDGTEIPVNADDFVEHSAHNAVAASPEPEGNNCAFGGYRVDMGEDEDSNGTLDTDEIATTVYYCNGADGADGLDGEDGLNALLEIQEIEPGEECPHGGQKIFSGVDTNNNGALEENEIDENATICQNAPGEDGLDGEDGIDGIDGVDGLSALVMVYPEESGIYCLYGGQRIESGLDFDGDSVLSFFEIRDTSYVCNGAPGEDGVDGANGVDGEDGVDGSNGMDGSDGLFALLDIQAEEPGAYCAFGGQSVRSGLDTNLNGVLDDEEISQSVYLCNGAAGLTGAHGETGAAGADGFNSLLMMSEALAGEECPAGGQRLDVGLDTNSNTILDHIEFLEVRFICHGLNGSDGADGSDGLDGVDGSDGLYALIHIEEEAAGTNCLAGGFAISTGLDTNNNGVLDGGESKVQSYLCHGLDGLDGLNGVDGQDGLASLMNIVEELAGANCLFGGHRVEVGLDTNENGQLDGDEVEHFEYICSPELLGVVQLSEIEVLESDDQCPGGWLRILYGMDDNGNGELDEDELDYSFGQCNSLPQVDTETHLNVMWGEAVELHAYAEDVDGWIESIEWIQTDGPSVTVNNADTLAPSFVAPPVAEETELLFVLRVMDNYQQIRSVDVLVTVGAFNYEPVDVIVNDYFSCSIFQNGQSKCWGINSSGQGGQARSLVNVGIEGDAPLGESTLSQLSAIDFGGDEYVEYIAAGATHLCAIVSSGLKCWGNNNNGQLGLGDATQRGRAEGSMGDNLPFVDLGSGLTPVDVVVGGNHSCALLNNGQVKCWGSNTYGQLGYGEAVEDIGDEGNEMGDMLPFLDFGGPAVEALSAGDNHTCALLSDKSVWCWGKNTSGQLGQGHTNHVYTPQLVALGREDVLSLSSGYDHNCVLLASGQVKCWGEGGFGRLGYGNMDDLGDGADEMGEALPALDFGQNVVSLVSNGPNNCVILHDNSLKCWGDNYWGQLGQESAENFGDNENEVETMSAINLGTDRYAVSVDIAYDHACAILDNGTVKCWGFGDNGQLGFGDLANLCGLEGDMFYHRCGNAEGEMGDNLPALDFGLVWADLD